MAESGAGNSRGLEFAERLLQKHGWEHGKGLGRDENGISEAIKVKVKCDKGGVGHKPGEQFTFHWWDHVFNQTSARLEVQSEGGDTAVLQKNQTDEQTSVSNRKPLKASAAKDKLYGAFVKSATLVSGQERAVGGADGSSSSSDDDDERLDLSSANKLSDAQLVKVCGGRTAHKGARHGLNMSAKLARLEQQEAEFMAKYGKKTQRQENGSEEENTEVKKKKKRKECEVVESGMINGETEALNGQTEQRKQKKNKKIKECEVVETEAMSGLNEEVKLKKKIKKSKDCEVLEAGAMNGQTQEIKQKKNKKSKDSEGLENETMNGQTQIKLKKKKSKDCEVLENEATNGQTEEIKQKKKKKEEIQGQEKDQDLPPPKKKKKKKSKE